MLIGIVGLGLIGGSFAKAYSKMGHSVLAMEINNSVFQYALMTGACEAELTSERLKECDLILVCTYPKAAIQFMEDYGPVIGEKPIVLDCCGTKRVISEEGMKLAERYGFTYVGGHPMAGTQFSGLKYAKEDMFKKAPMVIVPPRYDDIALLDRIKKLLMPAGFSRLTVTTAVQHDELIAYTSQLAHIVSSAYIKSPTVRNHEGISAGSYRDMTRVARLSPEMWTQLCMDNRDNLIRETDILIKNLTDYRRALEEGNEEQLKALFAEGNRIKEEVDG